MSKPRRICLFRILAAGLVAVLAVWPVRGADGSGSVGVIPAAPPAPAVSAAERLRQEARERDARIREEARSRAEAVRATAAERTPTPRASPGGADAATAGVGYIGPSAPARPAYVPRTSGERGPATTENLLDRARREDARLAERTARLTRARDAAAAKGHSEVANRLDAMLSRETRQHDDVVIDLLDDDPAAAKRYLDEHPRKDEPDEARDAAVEGAAAEPALKGGETSAEGVEPDGAEAEAVGVLPAGPPPAAAGRQ